jgi:hypothetical protein
VPPWPSLTHEFDFWFGINKKNNPLCFQIQFHSSNLPKGFGYKVVDGVVSHIKYPFQRSDVFDGEASTGEEHHARDKFVSDRAAFPPAGFR